MRERSFPLQLALSTLAIGSVIAGLVWLGQRQGSDLQPGSAFAPSGRGIPGATPPTGERPPRGDSSLTRRLLPASAWLVMDFEGKMMGEAPFAGQLEGHCAELAAPRRVGIGVMPARSTTLGVGLVLVAPQVSEQFWECARARVLKAGGQDGGRAKGFEVLESPSGILIRTPQRDLLFTTQESLLEALLAVARDAESSALAAGPHADMLGRLVVGEAGAASPPLLLTLHLPPDWLTSAGPEADHSPLRHLTGATLVARHDGSAAGALDCQQPGCQDLAEFLLRARKDLSAELPERLAHELAGSLDAQLLELGSGKGRIALTWTSQQVSLGELARTLLGLAQAAPE